MKPKYYLRALLPLCLAGAILRALMIFLAVEPGTGYFIQGNPLPWILNIFLGCCAVFFLTVFFLLRRESRPLQKRLCRTSGVDTALGMLAAVFVLAGSARQLLSDRIRLGTDTPLWKDLSFWILVMALFCGVFLVFFVSYPRTAAKTLGWKLCSMSLTVWFVLRLFDAFLHLEISMSHPYGVYYVLSLAMGTVAMMEFTKILCGTLGRRWFYFFGMLFALFQFIRTADAVVALLPGNPCRISIDLFLFLADALVAAFLVRMMFRLSKRIRRRPAAMAKATPSEPEDAEGEEQ